MSYYILPSFHTNIQLSINLDPINISHTLIQYLHTITEKCKIDMDKYNESLEYIYIYQTLTDLTGINSILFYNLIEINKIINIIYPDMTIFIPNYTTEIVNDITSCNLYLNKNIVFDKIPSNDYLYNLVIYDLRIDDNINLQTFLISIIKYSKNRSDLIINLKDTYSSLSIDILYILSILYKKVMIIKPNSGNLFLSERYIICKNLNKNKISICNKLVEKIEFTTLPITNLFSKFMVPLLFINKLEESNTIMGQQQIDNLLSILHCITLKTINHEKINNYSIKVLQRSINWLNNHNIEYKNTESTNIESTNSISS